MNPYEKGTPRKKFVMAGTQEPVTSGLRSRPGSSERMIGDNGEINANNKTDLIKQIGNLINANQSGSIIPQRVRDNSEVRAARINAVNAALADRTGQAWLALGEVIGDDVWETLGREGFARKTLQIQYVDSSQIGRIKVRRKDVLAFQATSATTVVASQVRQSYVEPPEFYLNASIEIEEKEIAQSPGDILEEKYQDGLEQIMVAEDKVWKQLADAAAPVRNNTFVFNTFTPTVFSQMKNEVGSYNIPVATALISYNLWTDLTSDTEFSLWYSEIAKHELVLEGYLGRVMGVNIITDGFRFPELKVLEAGEVYFCGTPQTLGGIVQRKELTVEPINKYIVNKPARGWFMYSIEGMAIVNSRAIVKGTKV